MKNSLFNLVQKLLTSHTIKLDSEELSFQIKSHPSYPSLHAVTGVLDHFNVSNWALDIPVNESTLSQLPHSYLAQIEVAHGKAFVVVKNKGLEYELIKDTGKKETIGLVEFLKKFTGIIVIVENDKSIDETHKQKKHFSITILTSILLFGIHFIFLKPEINAFIILAFSIVGIFVSYAIYKQELGDPTILSNALCSQNVEGKNCNKVLNSKGAKLFKNFKLSDLSNVYFIGYIIATFLLTLAEQNLSIVFIMSLFTIPVTVYSIYYQYAIIKEWCFLCLAIVTVLWLQAGIAIANITTLTSISAHELVLVTLAFAISFSIWRQVKTLFETKKDYNQIRLNHIKFKRNFSLFRSLLKGSNWVDTSLSTNEIVFGNPKSTIELTIITNPFCGFCRPVHTLIEQIYNKYPDKMKIVVRFNVQTKNPEEKAVKVTSRLLELYEKDASKALKAMHEIYAEQHAENWLQKWGNCKNENYYLKVLNEQEEWCISNGLNFTPEILVNGRSFPKEYDRADLLYFIEELEEHYGTEKNTKLQLTN